MNVFEEINLILEDRFNKETNGVLDEKWSKIWECVDMLDNKVNMYERIKFCGVLKCKITNMINMGQKDESDIKDFVSEQYLFEDHLGNIWLKKNLNVVTKLSPNAWVELKFEDGSSCDVAFDNEEDYNNVLEMI